MMSDGVRDGRIITTPPHYWAGLSGRVHVNGNPDRVPGTLPDALPDPDEAHFVYRRHGLGCRDCGTPETVLVPAVPAGIDPAP